MLGNTLNSLDSNSIEIESLEEDPLLAQLKDLAGQEVHYFPMPGNAGDAYITLCTFDLFETFNINAVAHEMNDEIENAVIVIGGGGNLIEGLYTEVETLIERLSRRNKKLIILPHTVVGNDRVIKRTFENLVLFCREKRSFDNAIRNGANPRATFLSHDITFFSDHSFLNGVKDSGKGSLTVLRTDLESLGQYQPDVPNIDVSLSWNGDLWQSKDFCRAVTLSLAAYLSQFSEITTDRLHIALLSGHLKKRVNLLPNSYFKNEAVFDHSITRFLPNIGFSTSKILLDDSDLTEQSSQPDLNLKAPVIRTISRTLQHPQILQQWQVDREFVNGVLMQAKKHEVVSLDVFDTSLTRGVDGPIDVFALLEDELRSSGLLFAKDLAVARVNAEDMARQKRFAHDRTYEVDIFEIYESLRRLVDPRLDLDSVLLTELALERSLLVPVPDIVQLVSRLREESVPFIFVTDTYFPSEFIRELLDTHGFDGYQRLFVSSELRRNKALGDIWQAVQRFWSLPSVLHVGDSHAADVERPRDLGIDTIEYGRARSISRHLPRLEAERSSFSLHCRAQDLLEKASRSKNACNSEIDEWRQLGARYGSVIGGSFVAWLRERSRVNGIQSLYFLARDGHFALRAWKAAGFCESESIQVSYLPLSRRLVNVAEGIHRSSQGRLSQLLLNELLFPDGPITTVGSLTRSGLITEVPHLANLIQEAFPDLSQPVSSLDVLPHITQLLQSLSYEITSALAYREKQVEKYLIQQGLTSFGRTGIVDIGWHGNIQASMTALLSRVEPPTSLHGFYMGLWPPASGKRAKAGPMESCFYSDFEDPASVEIGSNSVAILEEFNSAPHGSVHGLYQSSRGLLKPLFQVRPAELQQYREKMVHFQAGALSQIKSIFQGGRDSPLHSENLSPKLGRLSLEMLVASPKWSELQLLSKLRHCEGSEHREFAPLIHHELPEDPRTAQEIFDKSEYKIGQALYWWHEASEEQRLILLSVIRPWLESQVSFSERNLWTS